MEEERERNRKGNMKWSGMRGETGVRKLRQLVELSGKEIKEEKKVEEKGLCRVKDGIESVKKLRGVKWNMREWKRRKGEKKENEKGVKKRR